MLYSPFIEDKYILEKYGQSNGRSIIKYQIRIFSRNTISSINDRYDGHKFDIEMPTVRLSYKFNRNLFIRYNSLRKQLKTIYNKYK